MLADMTAHDAPPARPDPPASTDTDGEITRPKRRRRPTERAAEIVAAGLAHFAEHGYANTRLEDVAQRAGIGKSTIYLYFENKEALFRATVQAHVTPAFSEMTALIDGYEGQIATLLRQVLMHAYSELLRPDNLALLRIIVAEGERFPELRRAFYEAEISHGKALMRRILARGVASGEFADGPAHAFPRLLVAPVFTVAMWRLTFESIESIDMQGWIEGHVTLLMDGLRVR